MTATRPQQIYTTEGTDLSRDQRYQKEFIYANAYRDTD
jgi:hypothetical protein